MLIGFIDPIVLNEKAIA